MRPAMGIAIAFAGYAIALWGYCLFRGYNVSLIDMFRPEYPSQVGGSSAPGGSGGAIQGAGPAALNLPPAVTGQGGGGGGAKLRN